MQVRYNTAKPFPKIAITLLLTAIVAVGLYFAAQIPAEQSGKLFVSLGEFVCKYDVALITAIVAINIIELVDYFVFAKRDEVINANFELMQNHIGMLSFFKQYFAPLFTAGPYIFATEERKSALLRKAVNLIVGLLKFAIWLVVAAVIGVRALNPQFADIVGSADPDYLYTLLVLSALINCNVFVYALYRVLPFYNVRTYEIVRRYSDGSTRTTEEHHTNFVAMILLSAVIYLFLTVFYPSALANKIVRNIETNKFCRFVDNSDYNESILSFYREK